MKYFITISFLLVRCTDFVNAQNEQIIKDIKIYISETDSLIRYCYDCFDIGHGDGYDKRTGFSGYSNFYSKKCNRVSYMSIVDSIMKNTGGNVGSEKWNEEVDKKIDEIEICPTVFVGGSYSGIDTISGIRKGHRYGNYYQNNKLIAVRKEYFENTSENSEIGKIVLYINENEIIFCEKLGKVEDSIESIARAYKLKF